MRNDPQSAKILINKHWTRRPFLLLEVLIAFAIVAMAVLPLIAPHFYIFQQQTRFVDKIHLDLAVNRFYGTIVEQLQRNEIGWGDIEQKRVFPIDEGFLKMAGYHDPLSYTGSFQFLEVKHKKNDNYGLYQIELIMAFEPKLPPKSKGIADEHRLVYEYTLFVTRLFQA